MLCGWGAGGDNINWSKEVGCLICFIVAMISTALTVKLSFKRQIYI